MSDFLKAIATRTEAKRIPELAEASFEICIKDSGPHLTIKVPHDRVDSIKALRVWPAHVTVAPH